MRQVSIASRGTCLIVTCYLVTCEFSVMRQSMTVLFWPFFTWDIFIHTVVEKVSQCPDHHSFFWSSLDLDLGLVQCGLSATVTTMNLLTLTWLLLFSLYMVKMHFSTFSISILGRLACHSTCAGLHHSSCAGLYHSSSWMARSRRLPCSPRQPQQTRVTRCLRGPLPAWHLYVCLCCPRTWVSNSHVEKYESLLALFCFLTCNSSTCNLGRAKKSWWEKWNHGRNFFEPLICTGSRLRYDRTNLCGRHKPLGVWITKCSDDSLALLIPEILQNKNEHIEP